MATVTSRTAVVYRDGNFSTEQAPAWWPDPMIHGHDPLRRIRTATDFFECHARHNFSIYKHTPSNTLFVCVRLRYLATPILLPDELDIIRFWQTFIHPADLASDYGKLGAALHDHGGSLADTAEAIPALVKSLAALQRPRAKPVAQRTKGRA